MLARVKARRIILRNTVFDAYGGPKCKCCGETFTEFLTIDHINGGGGAHRKEIGAGGTALHRWLIRNNFPPGFQVLCWNCNFAKHAYGKCPHKRRRRKP